LASTLGACTHAPEPIESTDITSFTPAQLQRAFDETAACVVYEEDGACESMILLESISSHALSIREVSATDIAKFVNEPIAQFVRQLPLFAQQAALFNELEAQRARGGFNYLKVVVTSISTLEPQTLRWCSRSDGTLNGAKFYFSNTLSAAIDRDQPLDPALEGRFRAFLVAVLEDPSFRAIIESLPEERAGLDLVQGAAEGCSQYSGAIVGGRVEVRRISIYVNGAEINYLSNALRSYPLDGELPLRAN
jgi:hypothetical protein